MLIQGIVTVLSIDYCLCLLLAAAGLVQIIAAISLVASNIPCLALFLAFFALIDRTCNGCMKILLTRFSKNMP